MRCPLKLRWTSFGLLSGTEGVQGLLSVNGREAEALVIVAHELFDNVADSEEFPEDAIDVERGWVSSLGSKVRTLGQPGKTGLNGVPERGVNGSDIALRPAESIRWKSTISIAM